MKRTLLVIDDDANLGQSIKRNLELKHGFNVLLATSGREGVALAREHGPDVILLDVMMPGMAGGEVAETLREHPRTRDIPVIFLTGLLSKDEAKGRRGAVGGELYLAKPAGLDEIVQTITAVLEGRTRAAPAQPHWSDEPD